ncbi:MAG: hypothetical protein K8963_09830, partial [Proteobacteria bacterium]|nr:hypothetical protein [Pseudomonadota bacterium]
MKVRRFWVPEHCDPAIVATTSVPCSACCCIAIPIPVPASATHTPTITPAAVTPAIVATTSVPCSAAPAGRAARPRLGALIAAGSLLWLSACSDQNYDVRPEAPVLGADSLAVL